MRVYSGDEPLTSEERERLREALLADRGPAYVPWLIREFGPYGGLFMSQVLFWDGKGVLEEDKRGLPRRLYYRADLRALMDIKSGEANVGEEAHASEEGISDLTSEEDIIFLAGEETITSLTSVEASIVPASEEGSTACLYREYVREYCRDPSERRLKRGTPAGVRE